MITPSANNKDEDFLPAERLKQALKRTPPNSALFFTIESEIKALKKQLSI